LFKLIVVNQSGCLQNISEKGFVCSRGGSEMKDEEKTKEQLVAELVGLRHRIIKAEYEASGKD